jgi:hypothetical protein
MANAFKVTDPQDLTGIKDFVTEYTRLQSLIISVKLVDVAGVGKMPEGDVALREIANLKAQAKAHEWNSTELSLLTHFGVLG